MISVFLIICKSFKNAYYVNGISFLTKKDKKYPLHIMHSERENRVQTLFNALIFEKSKVY